MKVGKAKGTANPRERRSGPSQEGLPAACPALTSPRTLHVAVHPHVGSRPSTAWSLPAPPQPQAPVPPPPQRPLQATAQPLPCSGLKFQPHVTSQGSQVLSPPPTHTAPWQSTSPVGWEGPGLTLRPILPTGRHPPVGDHDSLKQWFSRYCF